MKYERINNSNKNLIHAFIKQHWHTTTMIIRGKEIDMAKTEGFFFSEGENIIGLITYIVHDNILEIISLNSLRENQGIINAIRFYQKRGFDMAHLFRNAMDISRKLKPEIPLVGENSIPLRHEIEFELYIN